VASVRVPQRVRAMSFTSDGECLVTCGDSHVKFWKMPGDEGASGATNGLGFIGIGADASSPLSGATATPSGAGAADLDSMFCVTAEGVLCAFTRGGVMEHWVSLEAPAAYGLSVHEDGTLAVACADGVVRLFKADSLGYVATLPRPPPLGHANIASDAFGKSGNGDASGGHRSVVRYPAALGCRLSPSGTKVVCIYADRGLFIWDVTDPLCVGKYRSFLAHGGCIWDVQRMPAKIPTPPRSGGQSSPVPDIPAGAMVTCSADNTVRLWDLSALDGKGTGDNEN
ncbi:unnamed protein product, partial [Ectocarpus fasciculatus]